MSEGVLDPVRDPARYQFDLPSELVAQEPLLDRSASRLLLLDRRTQTVRHHTFSELGSLLPDGAVLVVNNTRVIPARLRAHKKSGGKVELLLVEPTPDPAVWWVWLRPSARQRVGEILDLAGGAQLELLEHSQERWRVHFHSPVPLEELLENIGEMPLPPYIHRPVGGDRGDHHRYQTVFAAERGAVAAPTAGLHFTPELLADLEKRGIERLELTLHVGPGTFAPLRQAQLLSGRLHGEAYHVDPRVWERLVKARQEGRKVVAVGTTTVRTLESAARTDPAVLQGVTDLFITPGFEFRMVDHVITNFHLPQSSLLMLVAAFAGREVILEVYQEAIRSRYRFYSYGDASLIL